ncbi:diflavin oxidoreductase [Candidatus Methylacidithermus pantelleriae]|uniref:assimilatory sulfite reductase (NADPH) n=1 Tax=Candidatus Methylacidithermus pantelleriae TaxID=2744239 RepID=A0A8J2FRH7_9BACT|nr:sulfite reductase subunit alpha [Candidatus Methylacidithermus pantelleriae]CAF0688950.1 Sulfite reductase (NADPH) flavoprotein alpha-component [Candidatus Methylacidithermus pantelleriae]
MSTHTLTPKTDRPPYSRANPFLASIRENRPLTKPGSNKDTRHIVVDISGSGLRYEVGDSLGVFAENPGEVVTELLQRVGIAPEAPFPMPGGTSELPAGEALRKGYILNRVTKKFVKALVEKLPPGTQKEKLSTLCSDDQTLEEYLRWKDYVDVLRECPAVTFEPSELASLLTRSVPRLYSIASSPRLYPEEVHLTVAVVRYASFGRQKLGLASGYLAELVPLGKPVVPVYVQPARHFHLPEDPNADIIMVGPGTGIAPFRAFLQERMAIGSRGKNWLFFGEQHRSTDFYYEEEFEEFQRKGVLTRLDTAFSRDQAHKIYVQHRMMEAGKELWDWLQNGAYFYVCGDASRMAKDVHETLIGIAQKYGGLSRTQAEEYVNVQLTKVEKRYRKDVY